MPAEPLIAPNAIVLKLAPSGERFTQVRLLDPEHGALSVLRRNRSKANAFSIDLFDQGEAKIDHKPGEGAHYGFLVDFNPALKRSGIGRSYRTLQAAAWLSGLLLANPLHQENLEGAFRVAEKAFDALAAAQPPFAVMAKVLYLFARDEGYPVMEDWARQLEPGQRESVRRLLNTPLGDIELDASQQQAIFDSLATYVERHTHIHLPRT